MTSEAQYTESGTFHPEHTTVSPSTSVIGLQPFYPTDAMSPLAAMWP
jgi:hypothetical protein